MRETGRPPAEPGDLARNDRLQPALPKQMYVDPGHWDTERERVLHDGWFCVGRRDVLGVDEPGRLAVVDVAGESVLVTCDDDGALHGAYNVCRHRGSQVVPVEPGQSPPPCSTRSLRCPYHSWTYDLSGRLLKAPHTAEVLDFDPSAFGLSPVAVDTWAGFVFCHLTPERATSLAAETAGFSRRLAHYPLANLVSGRRFDYEVAANYKVLLENYNECYHCGPVHPELTRLVPSFAGGGTDLDWDHGVAHREGAWTFTMSGTSTRRPFPDLDEHERERHKGELVYPNLFVSCSADHVAAFVLWPVAVDRTRIECHLLFAPDEVASARLRPRRRRRAVGPGQPAGLGDLRVGAARHELAGLLPGVVRPDGGLEPGHQALVAPAAGAGR